MSRVVLSLCDRTGNMQGEPMSDTIRIRIAVGVTKRGDWAAHGWGGHLSNKALVQSDAALKAFVVDMLPSGNTEDHHVVFVEADVPLPSQQTVQGEVVE